MNRWTWALLKQGMFLFCAASAQREHDCGAKTNWAQPLTSGMALVKMTEAESAN